MMYKLIEGTFQIYSDTMCYDGIASHSRMNKNFVVKRVKPDKHIIIDKTMSGLTIQSEYNTLNNNIKDDKISWVKYWNDWIENKYGCKVRCINYKERVIDDG